MDGLKTFIKNKLSEKTRGSHISSADVSENWNYLKRTITEAISKFVPQDTWRETTCSMDNNTYQESNQT
jgi:hypothetical protein